MNGARFLARMSKSRRNKSFLPLDDALFDVKPRKPVPYEFVLDAIATLSPKTRSMFGCLAIYVQDKIVFILRDKGDQAADNGVWLATTEDQHRSLWREFPNMRSIQVLGEEGDAQWWMYLAGQVGGYGATEIYSASLPPGAPLSARGWKVTRSAAGVLVPVAERGFSAAWDGKGGRHCPSYVKGWDPTKANGSNASDMQARRRTSGGPIRSVFCNGMARSG